MREGTTSRVMAANRPYGGFYDFHSASAEYIECSLRLALYLTCVVDTLMLNSQFSLVALKTRLKCHLQLTPWTFDRLANTPFLQLARISCVSEISPPSLAWDETRRD
jgi:hypothetical protein